MRYVIEHQRPYGTVVGRTSHTSPRCALVRYRKCVRQRGSAVFIISKGREMTSAELEAKVKG